MWVLHVKFVKKEWDPRMKLFFLLRCLNLRRDEGKIKINNSAVKDFFKKKIRELICENFV